MRFPGRVLFPIVGALIAVGLVLMAVKPLRIAWYKYRARTSWEHAAKVKPSDRQHQLLQSHEYYRNALGSIGYLTNRVFFLKHISVPSPESREFWKLVQVRFPENIYVGLRGYETNTPDQLVVWDTRDKMPEWERFVAQYDSPDFKTNITHK